jgi:hypothetical protein
MDYFKVKKPLLLNVSNRAERRKTMAMLLLELDRVCIAENAYLQNIPENLQGGSAYEIAENAVDVIADCIMELSDIF